MSIFQVMGPIMIGPSSSHTAGAVRLGRGARFLFKGVIEEAKILYHGSFAETHAGHGTDRAVMGGILGLETDDLRLRRSLQLARENGIIYEFGQIKLHRVHPNSLKIILKNEERTLNMIGSSTGGGSIQITRIDDFEVNISGELPTLWILHRDKPGEISNITTLLGDYNINIAFMHVFRNRRGEIGSSVIEVDNGLDPEILQHLEEIEDIFQVRYLPGL